MRRTGALILLIALVTAGCSAGANVTAAELSPVVERDGIPFEGASIPGDVVERLAGNRVVLLGETHHLREHWAFVADLLAELHPRGFRQLLVEAPHMAGWLLDDYVQGGSFAPEWEPPPFYERKLSGIRAYNGTRAPDERIHVRGIDVNEDWYGGAGSFQWIVEYLAEHLPTPGPIGTALGGDYADVSAEIQAARVAAVLTSLEANRSALIASWGSGRYDEVVELAEVELASIDIRAEDGDASSRAREEIMKALADANIGRCDCGTVINVGGHHAQKSHLMGTEQKWMGDYLAHESELVEGSIIVVGLSSARTVLEPGAGGTPWDVLLSASPDNELMRMMAETWPDQTVFLPLDDPLFLDRRVAYNSEDIIYASRLKEQYDVIMQYGLTHRMPDH